MKNKNWCVKQKIYIFAVNYDLVSYKSVKDYYDELKNKYSWKD